MAALSMPSSANAAQLEISATTTRALSWIAASVPSPATASRGRSVGAKPVTDADCATTYRERITRRELFEECCLLRAAAVDDFDHRTETWGTDVIVEPGT